MSYIVLTGAIYRYLEICFLQLECMQEFVFVKNFT